MIALGVIAAVVAAVPATGVALPKAPVPGYADRMDGAVIAVAVAPRGERLAAARAQGLDVDAGLATIEVWTRDTNAAADAVLGAGGIVTSAAPGILEAEVSPRSLRGLGLDPAIGRLAAPAPIALEAIGGEGVADTGADAAHAAGISGAGVKLAVIDGGFAGYTTRQAQGDLPATLVTQNYCDTGFTTSTDHGTGVAEIAHEVAPGAELYLVCIDGAPDLAAAESYLEAQGVRVVNHSISHFNTSRGDGSGVAGTPDDTVERARNAGIFWANSSGNRAQRHWGGAFNPGGGSASIHDWVAGDERNVFTNVSGTSCVALRWDAWPVTSLNLDLYLFDGATLIDSSTTIQNGNDPPIESACVSGAATVGVEVRRVGTTATPQMDAYITGSPTFERRVPAGSVTEPASAPEAIAAGAFCFGNDLLEPFSSQGPTIDGRIKPDLSGPDGVSNATFGLFNGTCANDAGEDGFYGTSASSPHLAGAAALVRQGSAATPAQVEAALEGSARDLGTPGPENQFGAGGIDLDLGLPDLVLDAEKLKLKAGRKKTAGLTIENDGPLPGPMQLTGPRRLPGGLSFKYFLDGTNVTGEVTNGSFVRDLAFLDTLELTVKMRARKRAKGKRFADFFTENAADPSRGDAATLRVKIKKRKK